MSTDQPSVTKRSPGRPGLTRQEVADAFQALSERGITEPSLLQLREHLGRGSNTTIARLRQQIRGEQLLATSTPTAGSLEATMLPVLTGVMEKAGGGGGGRRRCPHRHDESRVRVDQSHDAPGTG